MLFEQVPRPRHRPCYLTAFVLAAAVVSILTFALLCVVVARTGGVLADAQRTLEDVTELVPEMRRALHILNAVCSSPAAKEICDL